MAAIDRFVIDSPASAGDRWDDIADRVAHWSKARAVALRELTLLLPFVQLLGPARAAFARRGGWMPRVETTQTLAAALGPALPPVPGQLSFDAALDRITGAQALSRQAFGRDWQRRDRAGFEAAVAQVVDTAHAFARAAAARAPQRREAYWDTARAGLMPRHGPGAAEQQLARVALEWANLMPEPATDRLFEHRPAAWALLRAGGADALGNALLDAASAGAPCLLLDADGGTVLQGATTPASAVCDDFEHEAQCSAAQVLAHLRDGHAPVALVALDRGVVRRAHALLARQGVVLRDETGWKLSTTRAAATVMAALLAVQPAASTDALLDWLKSTAPWPGQADPDAGLRQLESDCRRHGQRRIAALKSEQLGAPALALWSAASGALAAFDGAARRPLAEGLAALGVLLGCCGAMQTLRADDAGRQVLAALRLDDPMLHPRARLGDAGAMPMNGDELRHWVDTLLEERSYKPRFDEAEPAQVFIVPMARAMLRPFAAVVCPGADDSRLGAWPAPHALLGDRLLAELGLPDAAAQRAQEALAFAQLAALPRVTFLRRRHDDGRPLGDSPLVERLLLGHDTPAPWPDPRDAVAVPRRPVLPSAPDAAGLLPASLSASAVEALRACPYRFFALYVLRLREPDELEAELEKRDYGTWLHAVLLRFHEQRREPGPATLELAALLAVGAEVQASQHLPDDEFLPFSASFARFAPRYIAWLHARDAAGARWWKGEVEVAVCPAALEGIELNGRIDRIDRTRVEGRPALELLDYKTGSADTLRRLVAEPFEDTQLAFYAALLQDGEEPLLASYLALDDPHSPRELEHADVRRSAMALVEGLADDLRRLRAGAPMRPLGEAEACEYCAARGLCRRDHWAAPEGAPR